MFRFVKSLFNFSWRESNSHTFSIYREYCKACQSIEQNPYFEKYSEKITRAQKTSPEDLTQVIEKNLKTIQAICSKVPSTEVPSNSSSRTVKKDTKFYQKQRPKDLNQIMKLDAISGKTSQEIESIWKQHHEIKDGVYAVLPASSFLKMKDNLGTYPMFLFPLPRADGYEFMVCQYQDQSCYFTSLLNYQTYQENAPVCLTLTYFTELEESKGIVLMRGEYDNNVLKAHEALCLTNQLQLYYGGGDEKKTELVHAFNSQPKNFNHMQLISNFESTLGK